MKHLLIFVFPVFLFSCTGNQPDSKSNGADSTSGLIPVSNDTLKKADVSSLRPVINTIQELVQMVFASVRSNSVDDYLELLPTVEETNALIAAANLDAETKEKSIKDFPEKREKEILKSKERFAKTVQEAIDSGIVWSETSYFSVQTNVQMTPAGFEQAQEIAIIFSFRQKYYELHMTDCIKTPAGWRVSSRIKYDGAPDNPVK